MLKRALVEKKVEKYYKPWIQGKKYYKVQKMIFEKLIN